MSAGIAGRLGFIARFRKDGAIRSQHHGADGHFAAFGGQSCLFQCQVHERHEDQNARWPRADTMGFREALF